MCKAVAIRRHPPLSVCSLHCFAAITEAAGRGGAAGRQHEAARRQRQRLLGRRGGSGADAAAQQCAAHHLILLQGACPAMMDAGTQAIRNRAAPLRLPQPSPHATSLLRWRLVSATFAAIEDRVCVWALGPASPTPHPAPAMSSEAEAAVAGMQLQDKTPEELVGRDLDLMGVVHGEANAKRRRSSRRLQERAPAGLRQPCSATPIGGALPSPQPPPLPPSRRRSARRARRPRPLRRLPRRRRRLPG